MKTKLLLLLLLANFSINAQNFVFNGDFELWGPYSQATDWGQSASGAVYKDSDAQSGSISTKMEIKGSLFHSIHSNLFGIKSGKTYRISVYHKLVSGTISNIELSLTKNDKSSTTIIKKTETTTVNSAWRKIEFDYVSTATEDVRAQIYIQGTNGAQILVDNVSVIDIAGDGPEYTLIPDLNFEKKLIALGTVDFGAPDGKVLSVKIKYETSLNVFNSEISDLTGIEDFKSLKQLYVHRNNLTSIDVSKNTALELLSIENNKISTLDVSNNLLLSSLYCSQNPISTLNLEKNTALKVLNIAKYPSGSSGDLFGLFTSINLSKNTALEVFNCQQNLIEQLDLSNNLLLKDLNCSRNQIKSLDLSAHKALTNLKVNGNKLVSLNLKNGKNNVLANTNIDLTLNPTLSCIAVDDVDYSNLTWAGKKDASAFYSPLDCAAITVIPDPKFEEKLISLGIDKDGKNGLVATASIASVTTLNVANSSITDLTGIEAFKSLTGLDISKNSISKLDVSKNSALNHIITLNNPDLKCIQVADVNYALANWTIIKDTQTSVNFDCTIYTLIPDANFEQALIDLGIDKDGKNGKVATASISSLKSIVLSSKEISDMTGIEDFVALEAISSENNLYTTLNLNKNTKLKTINVSNNKLTSLVIDGCLDLETLSCGKNQLTTLNTSKNTGLRYFTGSTNNFVKLDFSNNNALTNIYCTDSQITTLSLPNATGNVLKTLWCQRNKITSLDVSNNLALAEFSCGANELEALNVSKNIALATLDCSQNKLKSLDVSKNTLLKIFRCAINKLESLNLRNGNNTLLDKTNISFFSNLSLKCIQVDDVAYSNTNWATSIKDSSASYNIDCTVYTLIPDSNFEDKLIALEIDKDGKNGKVATASIANITSLDVQSSNIKDLTGIQDFTSLRYLDANYNNISNIDISNNKLLTKLALHENKLTSLNVTKNVNLYNLMFSKNQISTIDLSQNKDLVLLTADRNLLTSLDISTNTKLESLYCGSNNLTAINVSNQPNLLQLNCTYTSISQLDVSTNKKLEDLYFDYAQLTTLDLSNNTLLKRINVSNNQLKHLDLSHNPILELVLIRFNPITSLNLQNGNNENFIMPPKGATNKTTAVSDACSFLNNKNLSCIQVDNVEYSNANWLTIKDATASYNLDCTTYTLIPDAAFEDKLIALKIDKDGKNGKVATASIASVTSLDISSSLIKDLTGIQDFTSLKVLNCSNNQLTSLNPASNPLLTELNVSNNKLTALDITKNLGLTVLDCSYNTLTTLQVDKNTALVNLNVSNNTLTTFDVSKNQKLTALNVSNNNLSSLNVKNGFNVNMDWFNVNFTKNPSLSCIQVDNSKYSNDNWNGKLDKTSFFTENCGSYTLIPDSNFEDKLIALKIDIDGKNGKVLTSTIAPVKDLNVQLSDIKDLTGIEDFAALEYLNCQFNLLTSLNVSKNTKLIELYTHGNDLTTLDLSTNTALTTLYANKNKITALDLSKNSKLVYINVTENALKTLNLKNGNNINFTGALLNKNTALTCISVDNPAFAASSGVFFKDATASYSATCSLGIEDSIFNKAVLYPNPTKGEVSINNIALEKATVYNSLGQLVKTFVFDKGETDNTIDLAGLPGGVYYVYLINGDAASAKKIIVE